MIVIIRGEKVLEVPPHLAQPLLKIIDEGRKDDFFELVERLPESQQKPKAVVLLSRFAGYDIAIAVASPQTLLEVMATDAKILAEQVDPLSYQRSLPLILAIFEKIRPGYISAATKLAKEIAKAIRDVDAAKKFLEHLGWVLDEEG
jgi:hypothetical protein